MSVRAKYKTLRQAKERLVKAMETALWRRKDWEDSGPDPADTTGRRRLWRWQGAPPAGGKVPRPRTQIRKPGTGRGARTTQETTPMSDQPQNTPIRGMALPAHLNYHVRRGVEAALDDDIANVAARRVLADLEEEEGREGLASVHRQLIDLEPYGPLTEQDRQAIRQAYLDHVEQDDEDDPVRITENYDPELRVWYFQVDRESGQGGDPVRYLVNRKRGDVDYDRLRNLANR